MRKRPWPSIHDGEDEDDREKMGTTEGRDAGNGGGVGEKERWKKRGNVDRAALFGSDIWDRWRRSPILFHVFC
jgi:hypothetical protein